MTKEALKLALEALEFYYDMHKEEADAKAITAIKQALANDALEKKAENARELGLDYEPQRTWVGLTEQEQGAIMEDLNAYGTNLYQFARAIEAKLKEKNT